MNNQAMPQKRLLIVDDDHSLRQMLSWAFEDLGYAVWTAADCLEAATTIKNREFDYALVDHHLPDGDGRTLTLRLKKVLPALKIMMMSADHSISPPEMDDKRAPIGFMAKPLRPAQIARWFNAAAA